jgi:hypothetical protein
VSRRLLRGAWAAPIALAVACASAQACSKSGSIVDGSCVAGYVECAHECVDLLSDPRNCGACDVVCPSGVSCVAGRCAQADAASDAPPDAGQDADVSAEGWPDGADGADGPADDGCDGDGCGASDADADGLGPGDGPKDGDAADVPADKADAPEDGPPKDVPTDPLADTCVPPYDNDANCGACGAACSGATPKCKPTGDGGYACAPLCDPPLSECAGSCVDLQNDGDNCGTCGNACITGLCQGGKCHGAVVGHQVAIGMNYRQWIPGAPPSRIFANAVFLPLNTPLRVLEYAEFGDPDPNGSVVSVKELLSWASSDKGRTYTHEDLAGYAALPATLSIDLHDVLLVHDQAKAPSGKLAEIGTLWAPTLSTFVKAGGVVVVLLSATGQNQMPAFLTSSGFGPVTAAADATGSSHVLWNTAPSDAVGVNVLSPFIGRPETAAMATNMTPGIGTTFVVVEKLAGDAGLGNPVVIHRVITP